MNGWDVGVFEYRFELQEPASYTFVNYQDAPGVPTGCQVVHYYKWRDYQARAAGGSAINRTMDVSEHFAPPDNICGIIPDYREGQNQTNSAGVWRDGIFFCDIPPCLQGVNCAINRSQTWTVGGKTVSPNPMRRTYACNMPTFSPF